MRNWRALVIALALGFGALAAAQGPPPDDEAVWRSFLAWYRTAPPTANPIDGHAAALNAQGLPEAEVRRRMAVVVRLLNVKTDFTEVYFDKTYSRTPTGNPAQDGFAQVPSAFLVESVKDVKPGRALDVGMGQGRNAVALAKRGWTVTGIDLSAEGLAATARNATAAGVTVEGIKISYADFDFGTAKWDLVAIIFAWAPVDDPAFVAKLNASLRPGGRIVFEHFVETPDRPRPAALHVLKPGQLRTFFKDLRIEKYEEVEGIGDWGGPGEHLVRMVAVKGMT